MLNDCTGWAYDMSCVKDVGPLLYNNILLKRKIVGNCRFAMDV